LWLLTSLTLVSTVTCLLPWLRYERGVSCVPRREVATKAKFDRRWKRVVQPQTSILEIIEHCCDDETHIGNSDEMKSDFTNRERMWLTLRMLLLLRQHSIARCIMTNSIK
jgi:hypothetical protein